MIKLKNILNEINELNLEPGDADYSDEEVVGYFEDYIESLPEYVQKYVNKHMNSGGKYTPIGAIPYDGDLKSWFESQQIWSSGNFIVSRQIINEIWGGEVIVYWLVDTSSFKFFDALIGIIKTKRTSISSADLSDAKKTFELDGEEVHWSNVRIKKKGYGSMLYDVVLDHAGVLFSDSTLYSGSLGMWRHHMAKKAFLGCIVSPTYSYYPYILPIDSSLLSSVDDLANIRRFVVLSDRSLLPKTIRRLEYNTKGTNLIKDLMFVKVRDTFKFSKKYVIGRNEKTGLITLIGANRLTQSPDKSPIKNMDQFEFENLTKGFTFEDYLEEFNSLYHFYKCMSNDDYNDDFVVSFTEVIGRGDIGANAVKSIKLAIVELDDVVLLLKNKTGGISVQVL